MTESKLKQYSSNYAYGSTKEFSGEKETHCMQYPIDVQIMTKSLVTRRPRR